MIYARIHNITGMRIYRRLALGKIVSKARQVRLDYQQQQGRTVTIQEVAEAIGITRAALSNIEHGKTKQVEYETLRKLCEFYGVPVGDLLMYEDWLAHRSALAVTLHRAMG